MIKTREREEEFKKEEIVGVSNAFWERETIAWPSFPRKEPKRMIFFEERSWSRTWSRTKEEKSRRESCCCWGGGSSSDSEREAIRKEEKLNEGFFFDPPTFSLCCKVRVVVTLFDTFLHATERSFEHFLITQKIEWRKIIKVTKKGWLFPLWKKKNLPSVCWKKKKTLFRYPSRPQPHNLILSLYVLFFQMKHDRPYSL